VIIDQLPQIKGLGKGLGEVYSICSKLLEKAKFYSEKRTTNILRIIKVGLVEKNQL